MTKSDYLAHAILDFCADGSAFPTPGTDRFLRLWTVAPGLDGTGGTEVTGGSYAATQCDGAFGSSAAARTVSNTSAVSFPTATASWGLIVAVTLEDAASGGNMLRRGTVSKQIASGQQLVFNTGEIVFTD